MADTIQNSPADLPGSLSYASIDTALAVSDVAYDQYAGGTMLSTGGTKHPVDRASSIDQERTKG